MKLEACYLDKFCWKGVHIKYRPRSGKTKLGDWKVGYTNLFYLLTTQPNVILRERSDRRISEILRFAQGSTKAAEQLVYSIEAE